MRFLVQIAGFVLVIMLAVYVYRHGLTATIDYLGPALQGLGHWVAAAFGSLGDRLVQWLTNQQS